MTDLTKPRPPVQPPRGQLSDLFGGSAGDAMLGNLLELLPAAAYACDERGVLLQWNRYAVELWGREPVVGASTERFCGSHKIFTLDGTFVPHAECPMAVALRTGRPQRNVQAVLERPDGTRRFVLANIDPMHGVDGAVIGAINVLQDITEHKRTEALLQAQQAQLRLVTDHADVFLAHCDLDTRYLFVNRGYAERFGTTPEACLGKRIAEVVGDEAYASFRRYVETALAGESVEFELEIPYERIGKRVMHCSYRPELGPNGGVRGFVAVIADVTAQRRAKAGERRQHRLLQTITDNATTAIFMLDRRGRCTFMNPAAEAMTGHTFAELEGRPLGDRLRCSEVLGIDESGDASVRDQEDRFIRVDGSSFPVVCNARPITEDGSTIGFVVEVRDITAEKEAEQNLLDQTAALLESDRLKDEFLATLAHELRNPLAPILNALHILNQAGAEETTKSQARALAERQVRHMARLLDDLLDVSRVSHGRIELRRELIDVRQTVERSVEAARPLLEERGHELTISLPAEPVRIFADPTRIEQVLNNLLSNAAKYTDSGGQLALTAQRHGDTLALSVRDNGIGINAEMLPRIFDLFVQARHHDDRPREGVGIGLTLVKKMVELHGGTVEALSAGRGQGSEFVVRLPLAQPSQRARSTVRDGHEGTRIPARRVLVVDDNVDAAESLAMLLTLGGHDVRVAHDGPTALAAANEHRSEIVLLDIGMPGMDGYEVAKRLRAREGPAVRLVALTGWGQSTDRERTKDAGFDHHVVKPIDSDRLEQLLAD